MPGLEWLQDYTLRTVVLGTLILGLGSGILGSFALLRRQSLLGDAVSHAALPGVALAYLFTMQRDSLGLLVGAALAGWLGASLILVLSRQRRIDVDSSQSLVLSVFFGTGLMLLSYIQGLPGAGKAGLDKFLFGQAAALVESDLAVIATVESASVFVLALLWKQIKLGTFDPAFAHTIGIPRFVVDVLLTTLLVTSIVVGLSTVGVILMSALLVAPAAAARQWTDRLGPMVFVAGFFGASAGVAGALVSSAVPNAPTGPVIVLVLTAINVVSLLLSPRRGLLLRKWREHVRDKVFSQRRLLHDLWILGQTHGRFDYPHALSTLRSMDPLNRGVLPALKALEYRGLVSRSDRQTWSLTEEGVRQAEGESNHES